MRENGNRSKIIFAARDVAELEAITQKAFMARGSNWYSILLWKLICWINIEVTSELTRCKVEMESLRIEPKLAWTAQHERYWHFQTQFAYSLTLFFN